MRCSGSCSAMELAQHAFLPQTTQTARTWRSRSSDGLRYTQCVLTICMQAALRMWGCIEQVSVGN